MPSSRATARRESFAAPSAASWFLASSLIAAVTSTRARSLAPRTVLMVLSLPRTQSTAHEREQCSCFGAPHSCTLLSSESTALRTAGATMSQQPYAAHPRQPPSPRRRTVPGVRRRPLPVGPQHARGRRRGAQGVPEGPHLHRRG